MASSPANATQTEPPYPGQIVHALAFRDPLGQAIAAMVPDFEALTGAKVKLDLVPTQALSNKLVTDQAGGGSYDLYAVDEPFIPLFAPLLLPLASWPPSRLGEDSGTGSDVYPASAWRASSQQGKAYGLPVSGNVYVYLYRTDLFEDATEQRNYLTRYHRPLAPPRNTAELRDVAEFFTRPPELYGFGPFTQVSEGATVEALWILHTFGVRFFDSEEQAEGRPALDEKTAVEALTYYRDLMQFAPPGAAAWHHGERMGAYRRGKLAQIMTWPIFFGDLEDPTKSLVAGKNGYALAPTGPSGHRAPMAGSWTLAIPTTAKNPALAAELARWWTSRAVGLRLAHGGLNPLRTDLLADTALMADHPWFPVVMESFKEATIRPRCQRYREMSDAISRAFSDLVTGQSTPQQAAHSVAAALTRWSGVP